MRLFKTQIFEKKAIFSVKKMISAFFSHIVDREKPEGTIYKGPKDIFKTTVQ